MASIGNKAATAFIVSQLSKILGRKLSTLCLTRLYYRAALLLQSANLSLHEYCLLWNYYATSFARQTFVQLEYQAIECKRKETFLLTFEQIKAFAGISSDENAIDYLLGAYLLFLRLQEIPKDYWLASSN